MTATDALEIALRAQERIGGTYLIDVPPGSEVLRDEGLVVVTTATGSDFARIAASAARCSALVQLEGDPAGEHVPMQIAALDKDPAAGVVRLRLRPVPPPKEP